MIEPVEKHWFLSFLQEMAGTNSVLEEPQRGDTLRGGSQNFSRKLASLAFVL